VQLKDYQEVAEAGDMPTLESRLVRFANDLGFGIISGALVVEHGPSRVSTFYFGNTPEAFQPTSHETEMRKRDPVMRRLKRLSERRSKISSARSANHPDATGPSGVSKSGT